MNMNFADFTLTSFKEYAKNNLKGFGYFHDGADRLFYANAFGKVFKWENLADGTILQKEITFPSPSNLTDLDLNWLEGIAKSRKWYGGVKTIRSYKGWSDADLDNKGIDPWFYAWMAAYGYEMSCGVSATEVDRKDAVTEEEFAALVNSAISLGCNTDSDFSAMVFSFSSAKATDGCSVGAFITAKTSLYDECYQFIEMHVPFCTPSADISKAAAELVEKLKGMGA